MRLRRAKATPIGEPTKYEMLSPKKEIEHLAEGAENKRLMAIEAAKPKEPTIAERLVSMQAEIDSLKEGVKS